MHKIVSKTLGGLSPQYYFRHFIFGLLFAGFFAWTLTQSKNPIEVGAIAFGVINTIFYPYSRFVYESIMDFIMGDNTFFLNALLMLVVKFFTMFLCWSFAIFIAPLGLAYLYYYHSKEEKNTPEES